MFHLSAVLRPHDIFFRYVLNTFEILAICGLRPMIPFWYVLDMFWYYLDLCPGRAPPLWYDFDMILIWFWYSLYSVSTPWYVFDMFLIVSEFRLDPMKRVWSVFDTLSTLFLGGVLFHDTLLIRFWYVFDILTFSHMLEYILGIHFQHDSNSKDTHGYVFDMFLICVRYVLGWVPPQRCPLDTFRRYAPSQQCQHRTQARNDKWGVLEWRCGLEGERE